MVDCDIWRGEVDIVKVRVHILRKIRRSVNGRLAVVFRKDAIYDGILEDFGRVYAFSPYVGRHFDLKENDFTILYQKIKLEKKFGTGSNPWYDWVCGVFVPKYQKITYCC